MNTNKKNLLYKNIQNKNLVRLRNNIRSNSNVIEE